MNTETEYLLAQDYKKYRFLIQQESLNINEYNFVTEWDRSFSEEFLKKIPFSEPIKYLNLNVYNEIKHDNIQLKKEQGL